MTTPRDPIEESPEPGGEVQRAVAGFAPTALRQARRRLGWTTSELSLISGVSASVLSGWERGSHQPTVTRLRAVAEALGVEITDLLRPSALADQTLADLRLTAGLTLVEVAERAGVHNSTISRAEAGSVMSDRTVAGLADLYGLSEPDVLAAWQRGREARLRRLRRAR